MVGIPLAHCERTSNPVRTSSQLVHWWVSRLELIRRRIRPPYELETTDFVFSSVLREFPSSPRHERLLLRGPLRCQCGRWCAKALFRSVSAL